MGVFPFTYQGKKYYKCTNKNYGKKLWCSTTAVYSGKWGRCKPGCKATGRRRRRRSRRRVIRCPMERGFCVKRNGYDQNSGVVKLNNLNGNTARRQKQCLKMCLARRGATGCEVIWNQGNRGCYVHTRQVARGNNAARHRCWIFSKCRGRRY